MKLQERIEILVEAGEILNGNASEYQEAWQTALQTASNRNKWFTDGFLELATSRIAKEFLEKDKLENWARHYYLDEPVQIKTVGIVMAGNIPLVGFHDFLCVFISGHRAVCKLSSKDDVLLKAMIQLLSDKHPELKKLVEFSERLNGCDAYIATGSDNSARYFEYYFGKYPSVIRRNRTSVAVLTGKENEEELNLLADDIFMYFGLGCRNVTQILVPVHYDFIPLLNSLRRYSWCFDHPKYRNNYDYQLAIYIMNNRSYMTNDCVVLIEDSGPFSAIGTLHYAFYKDIETARESLNHLDTIQAVVGYKGIPFGTSQQPGLMDYADGIDTMQFLLTL
jgi:hypothetical protein